MTVAWIVMWNPDAFVFLSEHSENAERCGGHGMLRGERVRDAAGGFETETERERSHVEQQ